MSSKIYCTECKYYVKSASWCMNDNFHTFDCKDIHEQCEAPQNFQETHRNSINDKYVSCPSIINRFNNCKWFQSKLNDNLDNDNTDNPDFVNE